MLLLICALLFAPAAQSQSEQDTVITTPTEDRLLTVGRVLIIGNKKTKDRIISRELTLKSGDTIRVSKLAETILWDKRKIYNLRLFNVVNIRSLEMSPTQIDLLVEVEERWYTWPAPIFELSDRNFNEWWVNYNHDLNRVNYGLQLDQYNVRGRNETLKMVAQFGFSQLYELSYTIPYIDKKQKGGLTIDVGFSNPRNVAYKTVDHKLVFLNDNQTVRVAQSARVGYTYRKSFFETHALSVGFRNNRVRDTVSRLNENYFGSTNFQQYASISYSFQSEHRDVVLYPLKGYLLSVLLQRNGFGLEGNVGQWIANVTYAHHFDLKKGFYLSNFSGVFWSTPDVQPYNLYGALGYQGQLVRGYEVYVIEGPRFWVNKTTFKKRIFSRTWRWESAPREQFRHLPLSIYWKSFADFGSVENYPYYENQNLNNQLTNKLLAGYGTGLDLVLPYDIVVRLEYAFTSEGTQGFIFNLKKEF